MPKRTSSIPMKEFKLLSLTAAILVVVLVVVAANLCLLAAGLQQHNINSNNNNNNRLIASTAEQSKSRQQYFGSYIGRLQARRPDHNISGDVFAVDEQTLFIRRFNYDGLAPDAYFWSSVVAPLPSGPDGFIVPDEKGSTKPLERYSSKDVVLRLPEGKTLREINWLSVWSRQRKENLADIMIEKSLVMPRPLEIGPLGQATQATNTHGVRSGPITIVDAQTFLVPDLHYDGLAPDAYFWLTSGSGGLSPVGLKLKDENGSQQPLRKYSGETVVISLPDELTIYDFDYFGLWCREFSVSFGQVKIPQQARVPPSPKMLGIKPENKLNCEILYDDLGYEIRWVLDGDDIVMQLVGKIEPSEYMAFGLGKDDSKSEMTNADAVVAWVERQSGQVHAVDYFLGGKQQCGADGDMASPQASCPDSRLQGGGDSLTLLHGAIVNGYSMVTFKRPQLGIDELYDQHVYSDGQQSVMWAIGQLNANKEVGYHRLRTRGNMFIDFARNPQWNCPIPDLNASMHNNLPVSASASQLDPTFATSSTDRSSSGQSSRQRPDLAQAQPVAPALVIEEKQQPATGGWFVPSIVCPHDRTFHAQIGPTGGKRGYESITGRPSWGVSWYINGLMIPELVVERGQSYRFIVEGGNDKTSAPRRHPLYLTDSQEGGFHFKTDDERLKERIFAGVALRGDGQYVPMAEGRLCEWRQTNQTLANPDLYQTFSAYQRTLKLECQPSSSGGQQAAVLKFSPDSSTPDTLYYQCYTHRFMGWRIRVVDSCAAYMASRSASNNNFKRDLSAAASTGNEHRTYSRRNSYENPLASELLFANSDQVDGPLGATELPLETDMLILNNSQLHQKQPYNLSSFDEVLKLSPADLEFLDQQDQQQQQQTQLFQFNQNQNLPPQLALQLALLNQIVDPIQYNQQPSTTGAGAAKQQAAATNKTTTRMPKTLQSYMRRLASIYYPVQQQLASMLSTQNSTSNQAPTSQQSNSQLQQQQQQQQQPVMSESAPSSSSSAPNSNISNNNNNNGFSLANLMPKPKIDLSKSTLSRKLNKLRFKSGRKLEPTGGPPRPANEFNYDIFNNQLAQLEKQQKQLQSLEFGWQQQQQPSESFQQQQSMFPILAHTNGGFMMEPIAAEQLNYQSSLLGNGNLFMPQLQQSHSQQQQQQYQKPRTQSNNNNNNIYQQQQSQRQPAKLELTFSFGNRSKPQQQPQQQQWLPFNQQSPSSQNDEHAIFITRLPQPLAYAPQYPMPTNNWQQPIPTGSSDSGQASIRYPPIQPYGAPMLQPNKRQPITYTDSQHQQELGGHLSSMPSQALTVHSDSSSNKQSNSNNNQQFGDNNIHTNEIMSQQQGENLSGSDSGSMYDFRQQPSEQVKLMQQQQQQADPSDPSDSDHMLAIERFSKLPSERRPPSIVHPVTGEHVLYLDRTKSNSSSGRYSNLLSSTEQPTLSGAHMAEIMDTEQSIQYQSSDLQRLNSNSSSSSSSSKVSGKMVENSNKNRLPTTAEPVQPFLVKPSTEVVVVQQELSSNNRDIKPTSSSTTTTTVPSTTEQASTQVSPPSIITAPSTQQGFNFGQQFSQQPPATTTTTTTASTSPPLKSNLVEPIRSTLVQNTDLSSAAAAATQQVGATSGGTSADNRFINAFNNPQISQLNFDSSPFTPIEFSPFYQQQQQQPPRLRPPTLIESMYSAQQERPEPPVQVASYLSQHLASHNPMLYMTSEKSIASQSPFSLAISQQQQQQQQNENQAQYNSPMARQSAGTTNDLIILKPSTLTRDNTYILRPEYVTSNQLPRQESQSSPEDPYNVNSIGDPHNEASRKLFGIQFDRLSSLSSPPSTSIALDPLQTSHSVNSYNIEHIDLKTKSDSSKNSAKQTKESTTTTTTTTKSNSTTTNETGNNNNNKALSQHRQSSIQIPLTSVFEPVLGTMGATSSNTAEGVRTNPGGPNSNTIPRDNNTDNAILSHVMSLISSNAIPTPPLIPVASFSNADYLLPSSDRIYRSIRG